GALLLWILAGSALALDGPDYVTTEPDPEGLSLVSEDHVVNLYVDADDDPGLVRAVKDLSRDIERVTGVRPQVVHTRPGVGRHAIIVGTLGQSSLLDQLVRERKFDPSDIKGKWDAYHMELVANPVVGTHKALVIAG